MNDGVFDFRSTTSIDFNGTADRIGHSRGIDHEQLVEDFILSLTGMADTLEMVWRQGEDQIGRFEHFMAQLPGDVFFCTRIHLAHDGDGVVTGRPTSRVEGGAFHVIAKGRQLFCRYTFPFREQLLAQRFCHRTSAGVSSTYEEDPEFTQSLADHRSRDQSLAKNLECPPGIKADDGGSLGNLAGATVDGDSHLTADALYRILAVERGAAPRRLALLAISGPVS